MGEFELLPYVVTGGASAAGSYAAMWAHLKFHSWRLDEQKEAIKILLEASASQDKRLTILEHRKA